jgi:hypothetical protein
MHKIFKMSDLRGASQTHRINGAVLLWRGLAEAIETVGVRRDSTVSRAKLAFF